MTSKLILALPSKGRLMEQCAGMLAAAGLVVAKSDSVRGYGGEIADLPGLEVNFVSSSEIAQLLKSGSAHLGITGEDLLREAIADCNERVTFLKPCGFGHADVVVAVPACWIDVRRMSDLEDMAMSYRRLHGRRIRVATKFMNLTRRILLPAWCERLSHCGEPGSDGGCAGGAHGRADCRHHHHGRDAARKRPEEPQ